MMVVATSRPPSLEKPFVWDSFRAKSYFSFFEVNLDKITQGSNILSVCMHCACKSDSS